MQFTRQCHILALHRIFMDVLLGTLPSTVNNVLSICQLSTRLPTENTYHHNLLCDGERCNFIFAIHIPSLLRPIALLIAAPRRPYVFFKCVSPCPVNTLHVSMFLRGNEIGWRGVKSSNESAWCPGAGICQECHILCALQRVMHNTTRKDTTDNTMLRQT